MKSVRDLKIIGPDALRPEARALLRPGEQVECFDGRKRRLPRWFVEVPSWQVAKETQLAPHFTLSELMLVDCREHDDLLQSFPHYLPANVLIFAAFLELLRSKVDASVYIAANGGYRSPAHRLVDRADPHTWACAADIYRIGNTFLDDPEPIRRYGEMAKDLNPAVEVKPPGDEPGGTDDHLHLELGYLHWSPPGEAED